MLLVGGSLHAQPQVLDQEHTARLEYAPGPSADRCPDEQSLMRAVGTRLGYDPFQPNAERTVSAALKRHGHILNAEVKLRGADGTVAGSRLLTADEDDCAELVAAMALAISLAIDPQSLLRPPPPASPSSGPAPGNGPSVLPSAPRELDRPTDRATAAGTSSTPPPVCLPAPAVPPPPPEKEGVRGRAGLAAVGVLGALPAPGVGLALQGGARRGMFSALVGGEVTSAVSKGAPSGGAVSAWLAAGTLAPCVHLGPAMMCGLGTFGMVRGSGTGLPGVRDASTPFGALGARAGAEVPINRVLSVQLFGDVLGTIATTTLKLSGSAVWKTAPLTAALGAAAIVNFP